MPVYVQEMTSDVTVVEGELPLSDAQVRLLVQRVLKALREQEREASHVREATTLRRQVTPPLRVGE